MVVIQLFYNSSSVVAEFLKVLSFLGTSQKTAEKNCSFTNVTEKHCHFKSTETSNVKGLFGNTIDAVKAAIRKRRKGVN